MLAAKIFSPLGRVTMTEIELFAAILFTLRAIAAFFLIEVEVVEEVIVIFFAGADLLAIDTTPLFAIVTDGSAVKVGVGSAAVVTVGVGDALGDGVGDGVGEGTTTGSTGNSEGFNTVMTRLGTDPPLYPAPVTSKVPKVTFALYSLKFFGVALSKVRTR